MERVLLLASLVVGIVVFLGRFLPAPRGGGSGAAADNPGPPLAHPALCLTALVTPFLGLLVTLPAHGAFFAAGQRLGFGFLIGGIATLLSHLHLIWPSKRSEPPAPVALAASYGMSIVAVTLALLLLRQSLFDGLMGVAIGGFCVAFALLFGLPRAARSGATGRRLVAGAGFLVTLAGAVSLAVFRDPLTPELAKLTWSAVLVAFAAFGTLLVAGAALLPVGGAGPWGRLVPLAVLLGGGGLALYELTTKLTGTGTLALLGVGGLLLWPVALAVLRETARRNGNAVPGATPVLGVPLLAVLVVASGFLAALQTLQGTGVAVGALALYLALPATFALMPALGGDEPVADGEAVVPTAAIGLLLFSTLLLLWRLFTTRWSDDLRGVNLSDQYALWGLLVGAALPGLLAGLPLRWRGGNTAKGAAGVWTLAGTAALTLAAPAAVLVLFGAKSAGALLIGLALGAVPLLAGEASLLPGLLALGVALALDQWTGAVLPEESATRAVKIRYLAGIMAGIVVLVIAANRFGAKNAGENG